MMLQPPPLPEEMLAGQVPFNILGRVGRAESDLSSFDPEAIEAYVRAFADPRHFMPPARTIAPPARSISSTTGPIADAKSIRRCSLWGAQAVVGNMFDCLADWCEVANKVTGRAIDCGHFLPEEAPQETLAGIERFIASYEETMAA